MLEAEITKCVVVQDKTGQGTVLMGVAEYYGDCVNFQVKYDWETLDHEAFIRDLREKLAEDLDVAVKQVNVYPALLLEKMRRGHEHFRGLH
jgi:hypothetical protein